MIEPRIILLEDDEELRSIVGRGLREEGFAVSMAGSAAELVRHVDAGDADALIIDIGLPDADGRDVVQALRARGVGTPVIFLTARDALPDRLAGFASGGDDYLTKPFHFAELVARLQALHQAWGVGDRDRGRGYAARPAQPRRLLRRPQRQAHTDRVPDPRATWRGAR